jgi:hypothetical protein
MPGAYAHMTLANVLKQPSQLESIPSLSRDNKLHIGQLFHFCELGAVSPDYPYLAVLDKSAKAWADRMHYERTGEMIRSGIRLLRSLTGDAQKKAFVWLLGYSSHVIADVTIHPIIEMKVGEYQTNKTAHRVCEMNQDADIYFHRLNRTGIAVAHHLESGIALCGDAQHKDNLDRDIASLWGAMLKDVYPDAFALTRPDVHEWHKGFKQVVSLTSKTSGRLIPFARHVAVDEGLTYPDISEVDNQFIAGLKTPYGIMDYDAIFDGAIQNIKSIWDVVASGAFRDDNAYLARIDDWDLDTGRNKDNQLGFWSQPA